MPQTDLYQLAADKIGCQRTDIANLNLYPGGRLIVKMKFGKVYDFWATPKTGESLVPPGKPFHVRDASNIVLTEAAPVDPAVGLVGPLIKVIPNGRPAYGIRTPAPGSPEGELNGDAKGSQGVVSPLTGTRLASIPLVKKSQVTKVTARTKATTGNPVTKDPAVVLVVHGQTTQMSPQVSQPEPALAAAKTRRRGTPQTPTSLPSAPVPPSENPPA